VSLGSIRPGDLVVYSFSSYADHVALYVGSGRTVDTATHHVNSGVGYSTLHRAGGTIAGVVRPYGSTAPARSAAPPKAHTEASEGAQPVAAGTYTVVEGDWLTKIARAHRTTWRTIYNLNRDRIQDPDLIYPGQVLRMPEGATRM
jgi:nucleoid-associated protein YgaU